jgi:hypothetical protein
MCAVGPIDHVEVPVVTALVGFANVLGKAELISTVQVVRVSVTRF